MSGHLFGKAVARFAHRIAVGLVEALVTSVLGWALWNFAWAGIFEARHITFPQAIGIVTLRILLWPTLTQNKGENP